jgi:alkaline phosphatase D
MTTEGQIGRRRFVGAIAAGAALVPRLPAVWAAATAADPFPLGVASGDPLSDGVVLWTRLERPGPVRWEIAEDERFRHRTAAGTVSARPEHGHAVHVDVRGLRPGRWYWYRFIADGETSPVGRTRTAPDPAARVGALRFAFASCQHYEHGYYTAYRHMADEDLDLVVHLGDYIYEHARDQYPAPGGNVRHHEGGETVTLDDYRRRLAQYRRDPDLQAAHAAFPFVVTWDDHEVANNYAGLVPADGTGGFARRRAAAYRAYREHMPIRAQSTQRDRLRLYRRLDFGQLVRFHVLDTRQYRSDQPCGDRRSDCDGRRRPGATMMGSEQERWLLDGLRRSPSRWNVLAQQVFLAQFDLVPGPDRGFSVDGWDGYVAARQRLLDGLAPLGNANPVVLTGDWHASCVADLKTNFDDPASTVVATEFVGTSISSGGDGSDRPGYVDTALADNPHLRFCNGQRGYVRCDVAPQRWRTDFRTVPYVSRPGAPVSTRASFVVRAGRPGAHPA